MKVIVDKLKPICPYCKGSGCDAAASDYPAAGATCFSCCSPWHPYRPYTTQERMRLIDLRREAYTAGLPEPEILPGCTLGIKYHQPGGPK